MEAMVGVDLVRKKRSVQRNRSNHSYEDQHEYTGGGDTGYCSTITSESSSEVDTGFVVGEKVVAAEETQPEYGEVQEAKSIKLYDVEVESHEKGVRFNANQAGTEPQNGHSEVGRQAIPLPPTQQTSFRNQEPRGPENMFLTAKASLKSAHHCEPETLILPTEGVGSILYKPLISGNITEQESPVLEPDRPVINPQLEEEYDVEKVLEDQESYDLFCPNCNSCITKRVIVKRRKRKIHDISPSIEEVVSEPEVVDAPTDPDAIEGTTTSCADAVKCLSCLSIFTPTGWFFGDKGKNPTTQRPPDTPVTVTNLTSSMATPNMPTDAVWPVDAVITPKPDQHVGIDDKPEVLNQLDDTDQNPVQDPAIKVPIKEPSLPTTDHGKGGKPIDDIDTVAPPLPPAKGGASGVGKPDSGIGTGHTGPDDLVIPMPEEPRGDSITRPDSVTEELDEPLLPLASVVATGSAGAAQGVERDRVSGVDIIKAIVYGGLMEMIASLSVVTSAAGADAATLNILALGAANVFGGLFILAHSLRLLKHETSNEQYEAQLGKKGHFALHATVAVLSYLVFGLMSPIVYAFSFRSSDNRDYKLAIVGSSALFCIILLSLAKARVQSQTYMKTLSYYVTLGLMACGASYLAGDLLEILLQKLGWFESSSSVSMFVPKAGRVWAS